MQKRNAVKCRHGQTLYHMTRKNADGTQMCCRVTGRCKTWKTKPMAFRLPVKGALHGSFYITHNDAHWWETYTLNQI